MDTLVIVIKSFILLSILNVWLLNFNKSTTWRGGSANSMQEEFSNYGLPNWMVYVVGFLKITFAIGLFVSIWLESIEVISGLGIAVLMLGAILMHVKIGDPIKKSFPAFSFLVLSLIAIYL